MTEHFVVLALARARSVWFQDVGRWASSAALPIELVKCVSVEEVRARLGGGRPYSALLVDAGLAALDRDLVDRARSVGCALIAVDDGARARDWAALDVSGVLAEPLERSALFSMLRQHATPAGRQLGIEQPVGASLEPGGRLVAVTGHPGASPALVAMALAQGLGDGNPGNVVLADLALDAQQALRHQAGDVVPGLSELVEAHRSTSLRSEAVRELTFGFDDRGYRLLAGLRRHRDWSALRPRATEAALTSLREAFATAVAEVTLDLEGEEECGSVDVEERNHLARCTLAQAEVTVLTSTPTPVGVHSQVRGLDDLARFGVDLARVLPVVVGAPRPGLARRELARDLSALSVGPSTTVSAAARPAKPLFLTFRRDPEHLVAGGARLPASVCEPIASAVAGMLARLGPVSPSSGVAVRPGTLGSWADLSDL